MQQGRCAGGIATDVHLRYLLNSEYSSCSLQTVGSTLSFGCVRVCTWLRMPAAMGWGRDRRHGAAPARALASRPASPQLVVPRSSGCSLSPRAQLLRHPLALLRQPGAGEHHLWPLSAAGPADRAAAPDPVHQRGVGIPRGGARKNGCALGRGLREHGMAPACVAARRSQAALFEACPPRPTLPCPLPLCSPASTELPPQVYPGLLCV